MSFVPEEYEWQLRLQKWNPVFRVLSYVMPALSTLVGLTMAVILSFSWGEIVATALICGLLDRYTNRKFGSAWRPR